MLYLTAFILGLLAGSGTVLVIRLKNTHRRKTYGFSDDIQLPVLVSDDNSKYSEITGTVDGSGAVHQFNN